MPDLMLGAEEVVMAVETPLTVLVLAALAAMVGLGLLVLLGRAEDRGQPDPLDRKAQADLAALKARRDRLVQLEEDFLTRHQQAPANPAPQEIPAKDTERVDQKERTNKLGKPE